MYALYMCVCEECSKCFLEFNFKLASHNLLVLFLNEVTGRQYDRKCFIKEENQCLEADLILRKREYRWSDCQTMRKDCVFLCFAKETSIRTVIKVRAKKIH